MFVTRLKPVKTDWGKVFEDYRADLVAEGLAQDEARAAAAQRVAWMKLRMAWFEERFQAFVDAQDRLGACYLNQRDDHPDIDWDDEDAPDPPEAAALEAVADAIFAEIQAAREGRWPRHLHFGGV